MTEFMSKLGKRPIFTAILAAETAVLILLTQVADGLGELYANTSMPLCWVALTCWLAIRLRRPVWGVLSAGLLAFACSQLFWGTWASFQTTSIPLILSSFGIFMALRWLPKNRSQLAPVSRAEM